MYPCWERELLEQRKFKISGMQNNAVCTVLRNTSLYCPLGIQLSEKEKPYQLLARFLLGRSV